MIKYKRYKRKERGQKGKDISLFLSSPRVSGTHCFSYPLKHFFPCFYATLKLNYHFFFFLLFLSISESITTPPSDVIPYLILFQPANFLNPKVLTICGQRSIFFFFN